AQTGLVGECARSTGEIYTIRRNGGCDVADCVALIRAETTPAIHAACVVPAADKFAAKVRQHDVVATDIPRGRGIYWIGAAIAEQRSRVVAVANIDGCIKGGI